MECRPWRRISSAWAAVIGAAFLHTAHGAPTTALEATTASAAASAQTSSGSSAASNRDSNFQILADGTQDLAALVGLFATNSVEAYTVDYSKGFLSTCAATLSLLGLLGWTKTMVKLGLGRDRCERAGFSTANLRPVYGVSDADRIPESKVFMVRYLQRSEAGGEVAWRRLFELQHTTDSMLLVKAASAAERSRRGSPKEAPAICRWQVSKGSFLITRPGVLLMAGSFAVCNFATCFTILLFRGAAVSWTWSTYFATAGLFAALNTGCWIWLWVYVREHLPSQGRRAEFASEESFMGGPHCVAYVAVAGSYHCIWLTPLSKTQRMAARLASVVAAAAAVVGYVCQYIEVRQTASLQSGYWLAVQAALAAVRILLWVHDLGVDNLELAATSRPATAFGELHQALAFFAHEPDGELRYPAWAAPALRLNSQTGREALRSAFATAASLARDPGGGAVQALLLDPRTRAWDMPAQVFRSWLGVAVPAADLGRVANLDSLTLRLLLSPDRGLSAVPALALTWRFGAAHFALRRAFTLTTPGAAGPKALLLATGAPGTAVRNDAVIGVPVNEPWPNLLMTDDPYLFHWSVSLQGIQEYWDKLSDPALVARSERVLGLVPLRPPPPASAPPTFHARPLHTALAAARPEGDGGDIGITPPGGEPDLMDPAPAAGLGQRATAGLRRASRRASLPRPPSDLLPPRTFAALFSSRLAAADFTRAFDDGGRDVLDRIDMQPLAARALAGVWHVLRQHEAWPPEFVGPGAEDEVAVESGDEAAPNGVAAGGLLPELPEEAELARLESVREQLRGWQGDYAGVRQRSPRRAATWTGGTRQAEA